MTAASEDEARAMFDKLPLSVEIEGPADCEVVHEDSICWSDDIDCN